MRALAGIGLIKVGLVYFQMESPEPKKIEKDWQVNKSLKERNCHILETEDMADVVFMVGSEKDQKRIAAHKVVLGSASPVFYSMLFGNLANNNKDIIEIPDVDPDSFMHMLRLVKLTC